MEEKGEGPEVTEESSEETEVTEEGDGEIEVAARSLGKQMETGGRVEGKEEAGGGEEEIEQTDGATLEPEGQPEARPGATEEQEQLQEEGKDEEDVEEEEVVLKGFGVEEEGEEEIVLNFNLTEEGEEEVKGSEEEEKSQEESEEEERYQEEGEEEERDQEESVEEEKEECGSPVGRRLRTRVSAVSKAPLEEAKVPVEEAEEPKKEEEVAEERAQEFEPEEVAEAKEGKEDLEGRMERKRRVSRQSSAESTEEEGVARRLRTRTAPAAMETDTAAEARAEPKVEPKEEAKEESVVVNVPRKKLRKYKTEFQHSAQARSEADVLKRVGELQREGLWGGKKLAKREGEGHGQGKIHWDFVLEEMVWLAGVVQQEVKTKKVNAKKCAMMIQKHFKDKELAVARAERTREANLKKIALTMAREVKTFWSNVNKLFEYRLKIKLDSKKKEALDQHLNFIVDKTEKYSSLLAESLAVEQGSASASASASANPSRAESVMSEEEVQGEGDDEYSPDVDSDDDEETIEKEEEEPAAAEEKVTNEEEIGMLENEAEVPIEDLLKKYYPDTFEHMTSGAVGEEEKVENKVEKLEDKETKPAPKEEEELKEEGETGRGKRRRKPIDFEEVQARILEEEESQKKKEESTEGVGEGTKEATEMTKKTDEEDKKDGEDKLDEYAAMAAELAPTGNTLATTTVKTKVPYLLKHTMREYQHIGLDWMVSLFERSLNGILADEMGLGKTIQTIAFLGHLALERGMWGPHLIVVPTSVMLNWEMEIKKWFPAFKVLVYYGSQKDRKLKRVGWTKQNAFHICITSYKLVIQDHSSFRRFKWQYFILDEAQHIKNFKSQRWQLLLNFTSLGRLLLTGTPLQNNLMELWSLMHFLMPHVFESHRDFKEWFSNPMAGMVEGNSEYNDSLIKRLHKVLRPFILRRLKAEVEKQMPKKVEHLVKCPLSKRQRFLYDDFMCRAKTKDTLASGNLLSVINVLMQLRKCCNHPNLFEPRPTLSPFVLEASDAPRVAVPAMAAAVLAYRPLEGVDLAATPLLLAPLETQESAYTWFRASELRAPVATMLRPPPDAPAAACPRHRVRLVVKAATPPFPTTLALTHQIPHKFCQLEAHPTGQVVPLRLLARPDLWLWSKHVKIRTADGYYQPKGEQEVVEEEQVVKVPVEEEWHPPLVWRREGKRKVEEVDSPTRPSDPYTDTWRHTRGVFSTALFRGYGDPSRSPTKVLGSKRRRLEAAAREAELELPELEAGRRQALEDRRRLNLRLNEARTSLMPVYGAELVAACREASANPSMGRRRWLEELHPPSCTRVAGREVVTCYSSSLVPRVEEVVAAVMPVFRQFVMYVPAVAAAPAVPEEQLALAARESRYAGDFLHSRFQIQTPDTRLIQYDCGKLQVLSSLLRTLFSGGHRVLVFTQMTKMLDVLEAFLNFHGYVYMRLDGSTKVEMRQCLMERFNNDNKYFAFILSTRLERNRNNKVGRK